MSWAAKFFAFITALIHIRIFCMESLWWSDPKIQQMFALTEEQAQASQLFAFNQGFYNLFLGLGIFWGFVLISRGKSNEGNAIITYVCMTILGASLILFYSHPVLIIGSFFQGGPAFLALFCILLSKGETFYEEEIVEETIPEAPPRKTFSASKENIVNTVVEKLSERKMATKKAASETRSIVDTIVQRRNEQE